MATMGTRLHQILQVAMRHEPLILKNRLTRSSKVWRCSQKLVGVSATIAVLGCGTALREEFAARRWKEWRRLVTPNGSFFRQAKVWKGATPPFVSNSFKVLSGLGFITVASCSGEDSICDCNSKGATKAESKTLKSAWPSFRQSCDDAKQTNCDKGSGIPKGCPPPANSSSCGACGTPGGKPPVSNKPCHTASSGCAASADLDVDALSAELGGVKRIDWVVESDLSHCFLIRQASQITVDCVTRILTEAVSAYEDYQLEYRRLLDIMMDTLEESRRLCGADLEVMDVKIILIRSKMDEMKLRIQELDMFFGSLEKLGSASAETAFMAHAEYASVAMSERMHSAACEVKRLREETKEKERDMLELQSIIIVETGKSLK